MNGEELTEQETALYDRQIRVWGADAQRRLSKSHILVSGLKGSVIEFCKNIVLAGVGSVTLNDDRVITEELLSANFLIPPDPNVYTGKSVAVLCSDSLKEFNPMVRVSVQEGQLSNFGVDFFQKFDVVVISSCSSSMKKSVNEKCRKSLKRIAFYIVDCRDSCGEIFVDLQNYIYSKKKGDEAFECHLDYPTFEEAISVPWNSLPRRVSKLYLALRVIEKFEELEGRMPGETSAVDLPSVQKLRKELCDAQSHNESQIPDSLLERLLEGRSEFPPVCAVIGGILGQEVIKAISGKGDPVKNFFFFDAMDGKGQGSCCSILYMHQLWQLKAHQMEMLLQPLLECDMVRHEAGICGVVGSASVQRTNLLERSSSRNMEEAHIRRNPQIPTTNLYQPRRESKKLIREEKMHPAIWLSH